MRENKFSHKVVTALEREGAFVFNVTGSEFQKPGMPDLQVYHPKWTGHLELKVGTGRTTTIQDVRLNALSVRGTYAFVLRWRNEVITLEHKGLVSELPRVNLRELLDASEQLIAVSGR